MLSPGSLGFIVLLGALTAVNALAIDMSLPALPVLTRVFGAGADQLQWTLSGYLLGFSIGQLFCGPLADRYGRRPLLVVGLGIFALAGYGCAISDSLVQLIACRFLQGIGACVGPILGRAIVRDLFDRHSGARVLSHITMVMSVAPLLAPILGGYLLDFFGWQAIFLLLGTAGVAILAAVVFRFGESLDKPDLNALRVGRLLANYRVFFTSRAALGFSAVACLLFCGLFSYISAAPYVYIEVFGVRPDAFGYFFAIPALSLVGGGFANALLLRRVPGERLMQVGLALVLSAGLLMVAGASAGVGIFGAVLPIMVYVFGVALIMPNAMAAAMEPHPTMAGIVSSLIGCLQMAGAALAGWIASSFYDHTPLPMAISVLAMGGSAFLVYHLFVRNRPDERSIRVGA